MTKIDNTNAGKRVELISIFDKEHDPTDLVPGAQGTYEYLLDQEGSSENQHSIKWDNGSNLMLLEGKDKFKFMSVRELIQETVLAMPLRIDLSFKDRVEIRKLVVEEIMNKLKPYLKEIT